MTEEVKVVRTIYVDNKLKKIYSQIGEYQDLNESEQNFFDQLFTILWINEKVNYTNEFIGNRFGYAKSTVEKKLRKLERSNLIVRDLKNNFNEDTGRWFSERMLSLDPGLISILYKELKLVPKSIIHMEEVQPDEVLEQLEEKPEQKPKKAERSKPILIRYRENR